MHVLIQPDAQAVAHAAADCIQQLYAPGSTPPVLGLATGSSPVATYTELIRRHETGDLSFAGTRVFMLDEYVGLEPTHEQSYRRFIQENFTNHVDMSDDDLHVPDGIAADLDAGAAAYDQAIRDAGGVDLQVLGIGSNGHIAFNEPGSSLASRTRTVWLTPSTISDNARFFANEGDVPRQAVTQGLGTIMEARRIVLIATGEGKAQAIAGLVEGPVTASCPASILQMHPAVTVIVDEAAASALTSADFHRYQQEMQSRHPAS